MNGITGTIFVGVFLVIIYYIIFLSLKVMYKDIKHGDKKKVVKKNMGLEIVESGDNGLIKIGTVLPINSVVTIGRKDDNVLVLQDKYASSYHAKIYLKNTEYIIEDLKSTNGTFLNGTKLDGRALLKIGDKIKIGTAILKVIG